MISMSSWRRLDRLIVDVLLGPPHDVVLSVLKVAVHVQRIPVSSDTHRELVVEHVTGRFESDLSRGAAHL